MSTSERMTGPEGDLYLSAKHKERLKHNVRAFVSSSCQIRNRKVLKSKGYLNLKGRFKFSTKFCTLFMQIKCFWKNNVFPLLKCWQRHYSSKINKIFAFFSKISFNYQKRFLSRRIISILLVAWQRFKNGASNTNMLKKKKQFDDRIDN